MILFFGRVLARVSLTLIRARTRPKNIKTTLLPFHLHFKLYSLCKW
ncbi:MAG: hypothetical protein NZ455_03355 [Bacteroidia bacterium]|nr:hypothetical protein [Bacteroidia bacterium]MDW8347662.1 hypothetical protein [Bacteroidia bacterium]